MNLTRQYERRVAFERLNRRYARHLKILDERPGGALQSEICHRQSSEAWRAAAVREAWLEAVTNPDCRTAAGPDSAVRLPGATGVAAAGGSAPGRQPATAHVQSKLVAADVRRLKLHQWVDV